MYVDQVKVKEHWFVPHFPPRHDKPLECAMMREWKDYMSYEDHHDCGWTTRLAAHILSQIPGGLNERTARVATTSALWFLMPVGRGFFEQLLREIRFKKADGYHAANMAIAAWAVENKLGQGTVNRLIQILADAKGQPVYNHRPYPTLPDNRAVEQTLVFLVSDEGRALLQRVCHSSPGNWLPL
jgi:hypothetical protein